MGLEDAGDRQTPKGTEPPSTWKAGAGMASLLTFLCLLQVWPPTPRTLGRSPEHKEVMVS